MFGILGRLMQKVRTFMIVQAYHTSGYGAWGRGENMIKRGGGRGGRGQAYRGSGSELETSDMLFI